VLAWSPDGSRLVVVEVKTRSAEAHGQRPEERVGAAKRRKLVQLGRSLLRQPAYRGAALRFDVIGVDLPASGWRAWLAGARPVIRHYEAAFAV